jgi:hypothetical protein
MLPLAFSPEIYYNKVDGKKCQQCELKKRIREIEGGCIMSHVGVNLGFNIGFQTGSPDMIAYQQRMMMRQSALEGAYMPMMCPSPEEMMMLHGFYNGALGNIQQLRYGVPFNQGLFQGMPSSATYGGLTSGMPMQMGGMDPATAMMMGNLDPSIMQYVMASREQSQMTIMMCIMMEQQMQMQKALLAMLQQNQNQIPDDTIRRMLENRYRSESRPPATSDPVKSKEPDSSKKTDPGKETKDTKQTDAAKERAKKLETFAQKLKGEGNDVSKEKIKIIAAECGLDRSEAENLITWLSEVDEYGNIDFTDSRVLDMLNIYVKAGKANGDMKVFSSALKDYADKLGASDNLDPECYDALAKAAGNPEGAGDLKSKIGNISGWWGSGSNFGEQGIKNLLDSYAAPAQPKKEEEKKPEGSKKAEQGKETKDTKQTDAAKERAKKLETFAQKLKQEGNDVSKEKIKIIAAECGLDRSEAENLITWLSEVDEYGNIDFTDSRVLDMLNIYVKAGKADGDMKVFSSSLKDYADKLGASDNLDPECYDALAKAAGNPEGAGDLKSKIGNISGWWGSGSNFGEQGIKNLLDAFSKG